MAGLALALALLVISILCFVIVGILEKQQNHLEKIAHEMYRARNAGDQILHELRDSALEDSDLVIRHTQPKT